MMKKTFLASVAAATFLGAASAGAADLPARRAPIMPAPVPVFTWSGAYIGVHAGAVGGEFHFNPATATFFPGGGVADEVRIRTRDETDVIGGIQTGYRWQFGQ